MPQQSNTMQAYLTPRQAAAYIGIGYSTFLRDWPSYVKNYGITVSRYGAKMLRVKKTDLDRLMDCLRVEV